LQHFSAALAFGGFRARHTIPNADELSVDVLHTGSNWTLDRFLDLLLDETSSERLEGLVEKVVFRVTDGEFEGVDFDDDVFDFEDWGFILVGRDEVYGGLWHPTTHMSTNQRVTKQKTKTKTKSSP
jgi:hypothetical protein